MNPAQLVLIVAALVGLTVLVLLLRVLIDRVRSRRERDVAPEEHAARLAGERQRVTEGFAPPDLGGFRR